MKTRLALGTAGVLLLAFGVYRVLTDTGKTDPHGLAVWLVAAVVLHDGIVAPATMVLGIVLTRLVPPRARRYLQGALVAGALVTVVSIPLIYRRGSQPAAKALERQDYALHLAWLLGVIAVVTSAAYLSRVLRDRRAAQQRDVQGPQVSETNRRPPSVQDSAAENPAS